MKKLVILVLLSMFFMPVMTMAAPTVYPTGTTIYNPEKCWSGYTVLSVGTVTSPDFKDQPIVELPIPLIDMNGKVVHEWKSKKEGMYIVAGPAKVFPGGHLLAQYKYKGIPGWYADLVFLGDWDGNILWEFLNREKITFKMPDGKTKTLPTAMAHHDVNVWPSPTGYYAPGLDPDLKNGRVLMNGGSPGKTGLIEVDRKGNVTWEWNMKVNRKEMQSKGIEPHFNTASYLGPNKWYEKGDERFHPENVIIDDTRGRCVAIISRETGKIVWQLGPDYKDTPHLKYMGLGVKSEIFPHLPGGAAGMQSGGMIHHAHMIPKGLPGEGNILLFNNGNPYSMIYEIDPVSKELVWEYSGEALGYGASHGMSHWIFFSPATGGVQRLPNGNTLICEGYGGRIFEVTRELETVWEFIFHKAWFPQFKYFRNPGYKNAKLSPVVYRAYRVPYEWVPQLNKPVEQAVIPPDNADFRILPEGESRAHIPY